MMTTPTASDFAKLFIALGEQTKAATTDGGTVGLYAPVELVKQYNLLAKAASDIVNINIVQLDELRPLRTVGFLAQTKLAADITRMRGDPNVKETALSVTIGADAGDPATLPQKPRVFIGCSTEGLRYAKIIQLQLAQGTRTVIWSQGVFGLSRGTLESLVAEREKYDYAVLVLTPDDTRIKREREGSIPRDNVIFELGLFMGALGRERVFVVVQKGTELPTDLAGIMPAAFDPEDDINIVSTLGPVTTMLEIAMDLI